MYFYSILTSCRGLPRRYAPRNDVLCYVPGNDVLY